MTIGYKYGKSVLYLSCMKTTEKLPKNSLTEKERELVRKLLYKRQMVFEKYPLPFALMVTFGVVATFYGFEGIIDQVDYLKDNPIILLVTGLATLTLTGTLYSKLK